MANLRKLKKLPKLDMNPMVDMAFLLVSFFMMTTTFKTENPVEVALPASQSEIKLPDKNICLITIDKSGEVYIGIDNKFHRRKMLEIIRGQNELSLSNEDLDKFSLISSFGTPIADLEEFLSLDKVARKSFIQSGIPCDSIKNELKQWIVSARVSNPRMRFAINADENVNYPAIHQCIETLRDLNITRFNLITETYVPAS